MNKDQGIAAHLHRQAQAQSRSTGKRAPKDATRDRSGTDATRKAARAVQVVTPVEEHILEQFDFDTKFGPCCGMTRIERWERAHRFDLNPPPQVHQILKRLEDTNTAQNCIWHDRV